MELASGVNNEQTVLVAYIHRTALLKLQILLEFFLFIFSPWIAIHNEIRTQMTKSDNKKEGQLTIIILSKTIEVLKGEMKPNIIIFNPDEMRADTMGHLGSDGAHTPFLDELAKTDAVSFCHAFFQNPLQATMELKSCFLHLYS